MTIKIGTVVCGLGLVLVSGAALARPVNLSVGVSTLGLGFQVSTPIVPGTLDIAVGINHYGLTHAGTYNKSGTSIPYTASVRLQTIPILLNYYPFQGVFRVTGGVMINQNQITANASGGNGYYTINGDTYPAQEVGTLTGRITYPRLAPYLGIGWGSKAARQSGFSMGFDLGVLYTRSPIVTLNASNPQNNAQLTQDVAAAQATANQKASAAKIWPVIGVRIGYDF